MGKILIFIVNSFKEMFVMNKIFKRLNRTAGNEDYRDVYNSLSKALDNLYKGADGIDHALFILQTYGDEESKALIPKGYQDTLKQLFTIIREDMRDYVGQLQSNLKANF